MKKIIPILIVGIFVLSGLGAVALPEKNQELIQEDTILLSQPIFKEVDDYITVDLKESTSLELITGKPILPVVTKVYTFPFGTDVNDVDVTFSGITKQVISKKIEPAPQPVPLLSSEVLTAQTAEVQIDEQVYASSELYPEEQFTYRTGAGLKDKEHVIYLAVRCYPVQYSPAEDTIYVASSIDIDVDYKLPKNPILFPDEYDMVIITPAKWESKLQELVDHKNDMGVMTTIKTVEDIYSEFEGRDEPEDIKLFIKDAIENWGIDYVLLFGGRKAQKRAWDLPDRETNNDDGWEGGYSSDLYYSDIYKNNGTEFEDWDPDGDGKFAEWSNTAGGREYLDYYPDVSVGRIDCRYDSQVGNVIDKIITYETTADDSWFKKALVISGDTSPPARGQVKLGIYEGEWSTGITADLLENIGFDVTKLWTSTGTFTGVKDVTDAMNAGAGLIHFAGHANPAYWGNFLPDAETEAGMVDGLRLRDMATKLKNGEELPFVVVGGCHNNQFNTTMGNILHGIKKYGFLSYFGLGDKPSYRFFYMEWVPATWGSWLLLMKKGGSIGTIGNSGLGYGWINEYCIEGLGGWINSRFFDAYANQSKDISGEAHCQAITDYLNIIMRTGYQPQDPQIDRKTIEEWVLLGDPSLKLGGYT